jgi:hypothetical protein
MVTRKAEGKQGAAFIGAMTEEKSVELASKIASESFLFAVRRAHGAQCTWLCVAGRGRPPCASSGVGRDTSTAQRALACTHMIVHVRTHLRTHQIILPRPLSPTTQQVGSLIIFLEYDRTRRKEVQKQQKEAAERQGIIERAREEREVRCACAFACACVSARWCVCCRHRTHAAADACTPCTTPAARLQRLVQENRAQQEAIVGLVQRLDAVEAALQALQDERSRRSMWGGFLGPRGL